jgi:deoxyribose-phosphate aldolase
MAKTVPALGVKASGGIRTLDQLIDMVEAGATRIGASATEAILTEFDSGASSSDAGTGY